MQENALLQVHLHLLHFAQLLLDMIVQTGVLVVLGLVSRVLVLFRIESLFGVQVTQLQQTRLKVQQFDTQRGQLVNRKTALRRDTPQILHLWLDKLFAVGTPCRDAFQPIVIVAEVAMLVAQQIRFVHVGVTLGTGRHIGSQTGAGRIDDRRLFSVLNKIDAIEFIFVDGIWIEET